MASTSSLGASSATSAGVASSFYDSFTSRLAALSSTIEACPSADALPSLLTRITDARHALDAVTEALPARDRASHEARLRECTALLTRKRAALAPPTGFAFRRKAPAKAAAAKASSAETPQTVVPQPQCDGVSTAASSSSAHLSLSARTREHLTCLDLGTIASGADVHLFDLQDCLVDLRGSDASAPPAFAAMQLRRLRRCVVMLGSVAGAVMVHELQECLVLVKCAQFRMHISQRIVVLLALHSSTSRATIEECSSIRFGALPAALRAGATATTEEQAAVPAVQDFDFPGVPPGEESESWKRLDEAMAKEVAVRLLDEPSLDDSQQTLRLARALPGESE